MHHQFEEIFADLISFPTVSADSNLDLINYVANRLDGIGAQVELQTDLSGAKANIFATIGPDAPGGIVLSGHTDVVPVIDQGWTYDPFVLTHANDRYFGRGTCDMKGFIAVAMSLAPFFKTLDLKRPIHFAFTYDEEVGCLGAQELVELLKNRAHRPAAAIVGEPTMMQIVDGHKGCCEYTVHFEGLAGHGSMPEKGVNAAEYAARYVAKLLELRELLKKRAPVESKFDPPWTTINVGRLAGGAAHNVIVSQAEIDWEMRPVCQQDADWVKQTIDEFCHVELIPQMSAIWPGAKITTHTIGEVVGLVPIETNAAREIVSRLTGINSTNLVPFGTEAGLFQQIGIETIVCGPGSIEQAHKANEFIEISQLRECHTLMEKLAYSLV
jgi:acetylornithine deacetylase